MVSPINASLATPDASRSSQPPSATSDLEQRMATFTSLAAVVLDESGQSTGAAKLAAYDAIMKMGVTDQLIGTGAEGRALLDKVSQSETGQRVYRLQDEFTRTANAMLTPGSKNFGNVMVDLFDSYSAEDQAILFNSVISPTTMTGSRRFADVGAWKVNVEAQATLSDYMAKAQSDPSTQSDPKFAQAEKLWQVADNSSANWTALVLKLFGNTPDYKIDLSDDARRVVGDVGPSARTPPMPYETGSIASKVI